MITRDYTIKNAELACEGLDAPVAFTPGLTHKYSVTIILPEEVANAISYIIKEAAESAFGVRTKNVRGLNRVKFDEAAGAHKLIAISTEKPKIVGVPDSRGVRLNFIKYADVKIQIWSHENDFGKGVGVALKELIFNHQPQPTGEQKCL